MQKKIVILGAGESGTGAALLAHRKGFAVFVSDNGPIAANYKQLLDQEGIAWEEGQHSQELLLDADEVIKSPGIPHQAPLVQAFMNKGVPVIDELEFAARYTEAKIVAITGTNGKTTTTLLCYHLLKEGGLKVGLAGNVGFSLARQLAEGKKFHWLVLEVSSFQIDGFRDFRPHISVILNITADHLNRYNYKIEEYVNSKFNLLRNMQQEDLLIYNAYDLLIREAMALRNIEGRKLAVSSNAASEALEGIAAYAGADAVKVQQDEAVLTVSMEGLPLKGRHNSFNMACAILVALEAGLEAAQVSELLKTYENMPHRMQSAGTVEGVEYINDSKATNVDAVFYALEAMRKPVLWIAGGVDKGNDYAQLSGVTAKVRVLICLGKDNRKLRDSFEGSIPNIYEAGSMQEALTIARQLAKAGELVLLSPACASFDLFKNYQDRGEQFCRLVEEFRKNNN